MNENAPVGYRAISAWDEVQNVDVPVHLLYPCDPRAAVRDERFGAYTLAVAREAPPRDPRDPRDPGALLAVVSHGTGSLPWPLRGLALHLARTGVAVALVEHPGNRRGDDALANTAANLANRPRHVRLAIDACGAARAAVIGHSLGAYTALAVAGGTPVALPDQTADGAAHAIALPPADPRVRALVLLAPAVPWLMAPGALAAVTAPILMRTGERDTHAPGGFNADIVLRGVPDRARVDAAIVAGANHFAFQSPYPPELAVPGFAPARDEPGFDRAAYQPILHAEIAEFLRRCE